MISVSREQFEYEKEMDTQVHVIENRECHSLEELEKACAQADAAFGKKSGVAWAYRMICGLGNDGITRPVIIDGKEVLIDDGIADIMTGINAAGIKTLVSCSGLVRDHPVLHFSNGDEIDAKNGKAQGGYVGVTYSDSLYDYLESVIGNSDIFDLSVGLIFYQKALVIRIRYKGNDEQLLRYWQILFDILRAAAG